MPETTTFDPNAPYEVIGGFDPSQPFEIVSEESERPPERESFTPPSLEPEIPRPRWTGEIPDVGGGLPPRTNFETLEAEAQKQSKLGEEVAGTMAEGEATSRAARIFEPNLPRNLLAPTTEEFLSEGEKFRASMPAEMRPWQQSPFRPPTTAAELSPETREGLAAEQALSGTLADLSSADQALVLGGAAATGGLPGAAGRILGAAVPATFGVEGAKSIYEGAKTLLSDDATPEQRGEAKTQIGLGATMLPGLGALVKRPAIPRQFVETMRRVDAVVPDALPRAKEAAIKKVADNAATIEVEAKVEPVGERPGGSPPEVTPPRESPPESPMSISSASNEVAKIDTLADRVSAMSPDEFKQASRGEFREGGFTTHAVRMGKEMATPEGVAKLRDLEAKAKAEFDRALELDDLEAVSSLSAQKQFFSEALEGATGAGEFKQSNPAKFREMMEAARKPDEKAIPAATEATTPTAADQTPIPARQAHVVEPGVGAVPENVSGAEPPTPGAGRVEPAAVAPESGTYAAGAKVLADKLREQFKTETQGGQLFTGPVKIINGAVEIAAKIIEYGGSAADALAAGLKYIRENSPGDEAAFRSKFNEALKTPEPTQRMPAIARVEPVLESTPLDPASGVPIVPPVKPPGKPPAKSAAATPAPEPAKATLDDVYKIFEPAPKEGKGISQRVGDVVESFRTGFSSKFRPLNKLAEDIAAKVGGKAKDIAGIFEQLKGSSGKAEADVYRFDKDVSDLVKGSEKDFNAYVFLRRSLDRLQQDAADITSAQAGENVPKLNRRRVSQYTIPQLESKLTALSEQIGGEKLAQFNKAAEGFQTHMDQALRLQVESGRMSPEVYDAIKAGNQFYAPFKVMKYIEETVKPEGSGRKVDTVADFTKAMEGIDDPDVKLGDMLAAARQNLTLSRTLAEKNRAMQNITELAALDVDGTFVQKLKPGAEAPAGMEAVNVLENGVSERYAVNSDVAQAVANAGPGLPAGIVARWSSGLFRAGATTLNAAFQPVNLLFADAPRASLVSKYGVKGVTDLVRYPMDFVESLFSSISADVFGVKNKLFQDFLDSGAAGTTVQQYLTPEALRFKPETAASKSQAISGTILNTIPQFANAIEQTSKVLGVKRAMRIEGAESGAALARQIPEAITEIRRFSGSPDFGRSGKWVEQYRLNLVYMFLNARIQGAVADVGRLTGRDGASRAAKTWLKMGTAVGIPTAYLYMLNNSDEYKADYAKRPEQEKQNYWLIPKDTFITGSNGEKIRDYWRVPKREIAQWMGNAVESGLDFANERDPDAFWKWAGGMAESIAPVNIRGNTLQERGESVLSGTHPFIKAPIETFSGRDTYRHRPIVPDSQKKASPEQQYDERTPDVFKTLADKMPDVAPEVFRSPKMLENLTKNFTAGLLTQFLPRQPVEGRSKAENLPLTQRFQALPYTDSSEFDQRIQKFERESADEQLKRMRDAKDITDSNKGAKPDVLIKQMIEKHGRDPKMAERIVDLYVAEQRGITPQERRILALPVTQRAEYLADELNGKTPEQKAALLRNWAMKRILTERVGAELAPRITP